ncbi:MAG TPA: phosphoenolpyruvate--protein phosphotransferase [Egibacteraceae bacterium]|nr:phosphoenolpyruvate--protein phosphotransferase [Egibacteraceae bacterium]
MKISGVAASPGAGVGPAWAHRPGSLVLPDGPVEDADREISKLTSALSDVSSALQRQADEHGGEAGEILGAQALMAADPELAHAAEELIRSDGAPAARAVIEAGEGYADAIASSTNEYLAARAADVRDVCQRVARRLTGAPEPDLGAIEVPSIILADDLAPAETARLDAGRVLGIAIQQGSRTSHTAILARSLGIPAVVAAAGVLDAVGHGEVIGVDGDAGLVIVAPDEDEVRALRARAQRHRAPVADQTPAAARGPAATADGQRVELAANVGAVADLRAALDAGAEGVGLFRTELAYLGNHDAPTEDEQAALLSELVKSLDGRRLVVRTFDFGSDKPAPFLELAAEPNPALGVRGIRLAQQRPELLDAQLRAVVRAAADGPVAVMAPMVAGVEDAEWFIERVEKAGGRSAGIEIGAMIEVPSAVLMADELSRLLDFLSIGTNDLSQYLYAADRQEGGVAHLQDPFSPALLRAVARVCDAAATHGAWVGVCGEAASDPLWALLAVGLGVTELSMGARALPQVRKALAAHRLDQCRWAAQRAVAAPTSAMARSEAEALA